MDLTSVADELYGLDPSEFTAARDKRAAAARREKQRDLADALKALRRPSTAAWAVAARRTAETARRRAEQARSRA